MLLALIDTAAIFYRLRILRYYQRKRRLLAEFTRAPNYRPHVTLVAPNETEHDVEYSNLDVLPLDAGTPHGRREAAERARGELVAFLQRGATPAATGSTPRLRSSLTRRSPQSLHRA